MKHKKIDEYFILALLCMAVVLMVGSALYNRNNDKNQDTKIKYDRPEDYSKGWETKTFAVSQKKITLTRELPQEIAADTVLCVVTNQQTLRAYADGDLLYEYGTKAPYKGGSITGRIWNMIEIPKEYAGKELVLEYGDSYEKRDIEYANMLFGDKDAVVLTLLKRNFEIFIFCGCMTMLGFIFCIMAAWMVYKKREYNQKSFFYMGLFLILCAVWIFSDSNVLQFFAENASWRYYLSFGMFMMFPIPLLLYVRELYTHGKIVLNVLCLVDLVLFFLNFGLQLPGLIPFQISIIGIHIFTVIEIVSVVILAIREKVKYKNQDVNGVIWGLGALGLSAVCASVLFLHRFDSSYSIIYRIGIAAFAVILCRDMIKRLLVLLNTKWEAQFYKELAYTDALTDTENRLAFEHEMWKLEQDFSEQTELSIVVFDVNDLKKINDTKGHAEGDKLIETAVRCIRNAFSEQGVCYRIGGDEFAVIVKHCNGEALSKAIYKFDEILGGEDVLSIAYGYAVKTEEDVTTAKELFQIADRNMYQNKRCKMEQK